MWVSALLIKKNTFTDLNILHIIIVILNYALLLLCAHLINTFNEHHLSSSSYNSKLHQTNQKSNLLM